MGADISCSGTPQGILLVVLRVIACCVLRVSVVHVYRISNISPITIIGIDTDRRSSDPDPDSGTRDTRSRSAVAVIGYRLSALCFLLHKCIFICIIYISVSVSV